MENILKIIGRILIVAIIILTFLFFIGFKVGMYWIACFVTLILTSLFLPKEEEE